MADSKTMYKIVVSGVTFTFSEASLRSDSPDTNLLAMSLLGDFAEAEQRTLVLDRNATTFKFVRDHLAGYTVFPFGDQDHEGMSAVKFLQYLQDDCDYYGLQRLKGLVDDELQRRKALQADKVVKPKLEVSVAVDVPKAPSLEMCIQGHIAVVEGWKLQLLCAKEEYDRLSSPFAYRMKSDKERKLASASEALSSMLEQQKISQMKS